MRFVLLGAVFSGVLSIVMTQESHVNDCFATASEGRYEGCFEDSSNRVLDQELEVSEYNSVSYCMRYCAERNFLYAGVQYYKECFCGNTMKRRVKKDDSECNTKCSGSEEACGGSWRMSVFRTDLEDAPQKGTYEGCFVDASDRILDQAFTNSDINSPVFCMDYCSQRGFLYAGVQYYKECFCGNTMKRQEKKDDSECNTKCSGSNDNCGGGWRMSVFRTEQKDAPQKGTYKGCFVDASDRILDQASTESNKNSPVFCMDYCKRRGFLYAGVQYYKECFCGNTMKRQEKKDDSECNTKCSGSNDNCGGGWRMSVYMTEQEDAPQKGSTSFMLPSDGCSECSCTWTGLTYEVLCESTIVCPQLQCPESLYQISEGECCPTCKPEPGCYINDQIGYVETGMTYPTEDPCETCMCEDGGQTICAIMDCAPCPADYLRETDGTCCGQCKYCPKKCPKLPCKKKNQFQDEDMCCPECMCTYKKDLVKPGPVGDECGGCECVDGKVTCNPVQCMSITKLECVDPVRGEDCCYTCPNGETCRHPKKKTMVMQKGEVYRVKKNVCMCSPTFWYPYAFCTKTKVKDNVFDGVDDEAKEHIATWSLPKK